MCKSSVNAALEHFEEYEANKEEADYIAGVAEFRTYMTAYLCLEVCLSIRNCIKRAPKSTVPGQHRFGF